MRSRSSSFFAPTMLVIDPFVGDVLDRISGPLRLLDAPKGLALVLLVAGRAACSAGRRRGCRGCCPERGSDRRPHRRAFCPATAEGIWRRSHSPMRMRPLNDVMRRARICARMLAADVAAGDQRHLGGQRDFERCVVQDHAAMGIAARAIPRRRADLPAPGFRPRALCENSSGARRSSEKCCAT